MQLVLSDAHDFFARFDAFEHCDTTIAHFPGAYDTRIRREPTFYWFDYVHRVALQRVRHRRLRDRHDILLLTEIDIELREHAGQHSALVLELRTQQDVARVRIDPRIDGCNRCAEGAVRIRIDMHAD